MLYKSGGAKNIADIFLPKGLEILIRGLKVVQKFLTPILKAEKEILYSWIQTKGRK